MTARKIIVVPCIVKSALKVWAPSTWPLGWASGTTAEEVGGGLGGRPGRGGPGAPKGRGVGPTTRRRDAGDRVAADTRAFRENRRALRRRGVGGGRRLLEPDPRLPGLGSV